MYARLSHPLSAEAIQRHRFVNRLQAADIFRPGCMTVSLSIDADLGACEWLEHLTPPAGYSLQGSAAQHFKCGGCVVHYNLCLVDKGRGALPGSPSTVLDNVFGSLAGACPASHLS